MSVLEGLVISERLLAELHRRNTHLEAQQHQMSQEARTQVHGEITGLRGALGIALGGTVPGGSADTLGHREYASWAATSTAAAASCACSQCSASAGDVA